MDGFFFLSFIEIDFLPCFDYIIAIKKEFFLKNYYEYTAKVSVNFSFYVLLPLHILNEVFNYLKKIPQINILTIFLFQTFHFDYFYTKKQTNKKTKI